MLVSVKHSPPASFESISLLLTLAVYHQHTVAFVILLAGTVVIGDEPLTHFFDALLHRLELELEVRSCCQLCKQARIAGCLFELPVALGLVELVGMCVWAGVRVSVWAMVGCGDLWCGGCGRLW